MAEEKLNLNIECGSYKLFELAENYKKSIENINEIVKGTKVLKEIILASGKENELNEGFVEGLDKSVEEYEAQKETFGKRLACCKYIIDTINKQDDTAVLYERAVTLVLLAIGVPLQENNEEQEDKADDEGK